jgi:hypothetical protein
MPGHFHPRDGVNSSINFGAYVGNLTAASTNPRQLDIHVRAQSLLCGLQAGFLYDYILPVEEMAAWYAPFVVLLGLDEPLMDARIWNRTSAEWTQPRLCFYTPDADGDCDVARRAIEAVRRCGQRAQGVANGVGSAVETTSVSGATRSNVPTQQPQQQKDGVHHGLAQTQHSTGAVAKLYAYYTPELARQVTSWAHSDLELLRYPVWEANASESDGLSLRAELNAIAASQAVAQAVGGSMGGELTVRHPGQMGWSSGAQAAAAVVVSGVCVGVGAAALVLRATARRRTNTRLPTKKAGLQYADLAVNEEHEDAPSTDVSSLTRAL